MHRLVAVTEGRPDVARAHVRIHQRDLDTCRRGSLVHALTELQGAARQRQDNELPLTIAPRPRGQLPDGLAHAAPQPRQLSGVAAVDNTALADVRAGRAGDPVGELRRDWRRP
jgi:hypothetical protein